MNIPLLIFQQASQKECCHVVHATINALEKLWPTEKKSFGSQSDLKTENMSCQ